MFPLIQDAFHAYTLPIEQTLKAAFQYPSTTPCTACATQIERIQNHPLFGTEKTDQLIIPVDDSFSVETSHLLRLDEHMGMPAITTHDFCETCLTQFYYEWSGFSEDQYIRFTCFEPTIPNYLSLLANLKNVYTQRFAPYLTTYFQSQTHDVTVYVSLDEALKRSNHENLVSYYEKEGKPLEDLQNVTTIPTEKEMFVKSRIGCIYEKEFIQTCIYPAKHISFEYDTYFGRIMAKINTEHIQSRLFFDVYTQSFVPWEEIDVANIHMIKRNHDTYDYFDQQRNHHALTANSDFNEIDVLFDSYFDTLSKTLMHNLFGEVYTTYLQDQQHRQFEWDAQMDELIEAMRKRNITLKTKESTPKPTSVGGFTYYDHVLVKDGLYKGMKGCVKEIDTQNETIGIVFFGETNFRNVIHLSPALCEKFLN